MRLQVLMFYQDDPRKCTAVKIVKFGLAKSIKRIGPRGLVLHPFSKEILLPKDRLRVRSVVGIDCSWNLAVKTLSEKKFTGIPRSLPPLLAGNPVNYSKLGKLTTVEALAAALFILGSKQQGMELLDKFKWGHTFYDLNKNLLDEYSRVESESQIEPILRDYGLM